MRNCSELFQKKKVFNVTNRSIVPIYIIYRVKTWFIKKDMLSLQTSHTKLWQGLRIDKGLVYSF